MEDLYRYYDKIIDNIQGAKTKGQLQVCFKMYENHFKLVKNTKYFSDSKDQRVGKMLIDKEEKFNV